MPRDMIRKRATWKAYYAKNVVRLRAASRARARAARLADPDAVRRRQRQWFKKNPDRLKHFSLKQIFGISLQDYQKMLVSQGGVCAICKKVETSTCYGKVRALAVDHDHQTGKIRGLLCNHCNRMLGAAFDNSALLLEAVEYLRSYEE